MGEIIQRREDLPTTLDDLSRFVLVGREKLTAVRAEIRAIDKVGVATGVREQKLKEAQAISEAVLDAEVRIGELMANVPKKQGFASAIRDTGVANVETKTEVIEAAGFTPKQVERFQQLAAHPEIIEQAKAEARGNDDIVSRSLVLSMIKQKKKEEHQQQRAEAITEQMTDGGNCIDIYNTGNKYRVIYADPPWSYDDKQNIDGLGGAVKHYNLMQLAEICNLPVKKLAEDNAVLFLWVTSPMLRHSFTVFASWGFEYKASFVWDKIGHNMGHYNSVRHEFLLIGTRGSCTPDNKILFDSVQSIQKSDHSRKPEEFRNIIDTIYPIGNRLELFSRNKVRNWDVWGDMA